MLLELDRLTVRYGRRVALDDISLAIDSRALGLLGPNGAGKSTLIRALLGLTPISAGRAKLEGLSASDRGLALRERVGYMPEHESHLTGMTVVRFLRYMGELCGLAPETAMERAHETLFLVGLGEARYRKLEGFSYGMLQKVRLAQALIHGPSVLILDEPTNGLDPAAREEMLGLISRMVETSEVKVIVCSHLLKDIETCCREVMVLKRGRVVAAGNIEAMKQTRRQVYEVRVRGSLDRFMAGLSERGCECRLGARDVLEIATPDGMTTRALFEIARERSAQLRHFYAKRDTLEDIFLKAMEDEAPAEAAEGDGRDAGL